jgi:threonyl-tRNA synthetase
VREHSLAKIPALLVLGKKEAETYSVSIRRPCSERQQDTDRRGDHRAGQ